MKKTTAIIVNWNDKDVIGQCIQSILNQNRPNIEIIVSDNGSNDGSVNFIRDRFPSVKIITNGENLGFGSAVNRGLSSAKGDYLIFLNSDLALDAKCIGALAMFLDSDSSIGGVIPKILYGIIGNGITVRITESEGTSIIVSTSPFIFYGIIGNSIAVRITESNAIVILDNIIRNSIAI